MLAVADQSHVAQFTFKVVCKIMEGTEGAAEKIAALAEVKKAYYEEKLAMKRHQQKLLEIEHAQKMKVLELQQKIAVKQLT